MSSEPPPAYRYPAPAGPFPTAVRGRRPRAVRVATTMAFLEGAALLLTTPPALFVLLVARMSEPAPGSSQNRGMVAGWGVVAVVLTVAGSVLFLTTAVLLRGGRSAATAVWIAGLVLVLLTAAIWIAHGGPPTWAAALGYAALPLGGLVAVLRPESRRWLAGERPGGRS